MTIKVIFILFYFQSSRGQHLKHMIFNYSLIIFSPLYNFKPVLLYSMEHKDILRNITFIFLFYIHTVMNLVATHSNCTSPMDYISHHALHSHIPVHHYTHHTAVTIHSLFLIVSPHLHLIHSHTFKQHSHGEVLFCPG